jgi:ATP-dependent helicase/nuclease subunit B
VAKALAANADGWVILPKTQRGLALAERLGGESFAIDHAAQVAERRVAIAADPLEEAHAVAAAVREAIAERRTPVAVVAADRDVSRRVQAVLTAQGMRAMDSAGTPLNETAAGRLALALAAALAAPLPEAMAGLCAQPLARPFEGWARAAEALDVALWRGLPARDWRGWRDKWRAAERFPTRQQEPWMPVAEPAWRALAEIFEAWPRRRQRLAEWMAQLGRAMDTLAPGWETAEGGTEVAVLLAAMGGEAVAGFDLAQALLVLEMAQRKVNTGSALAEVHLWGEQEARLQRVGTLVVAGCNEGAWPPAVHDPWLSQAQLAMLGLAVNARRA